ncbi:MAG: FixH family protein [Deferribacteres bacterium]|nr:FixH family protein [Deferribacteres bacterium]
MKKIPIFLIVAIFLAGSLYAAEYEIVKVVDDLQVKILMDNNPPAKGENNLNIILTDPEGKPVTKARIKVDYSMPPMKNMPTMIYKTRAKLKGETYKATVNFSMSGRWDIDVNIKRPGKSLAKVSFSVNVS